MGREVRRVPANWQHPRNERGNYKPLHESDMDPLDRVAKWVDDARAWRDGTHPDREDRPYTFSEWDGGPPDPDDYMPFWPEAERTHWQMYETTSEGTPISPVCESPEALARWLADNGASAFGGMTANYDDWFAMIVGPGWAPSAVMDSRGLRSGVEGL